MSEPAEGVETTAVRTANGLHQTRIMSRTANDHINHTDADDSTDHDRGDHEGAETDATGRFTGRGESR